MNKELDEAIKRLKEDLSKANNNMFLTTSSTVIEIALQALEDSIPKKKVENRLKNIEEMLVKTTRGELQKYTPGELILIKTIYNELLEE